MQIWATIIRENLPPVLILESDAAWDVKIRKIMPNPNRNFRRLLNDIGSSALLNPGRWAYDDDSNTNVAKDTWMSNHWDVFSVGHSHEDRDGYNSTIFYDDAYVPLTAQYGDRAISHERVILKSKGIVCTTGYAIGQRGAAKLLLKTNINFDQPVDLIIQDMIWNHELVAYHTYPPVVSQWRYVPDIGMDEADSDINKIDPAAEGTEEAWAEVNRTHNVWTLWYNPANSFDELALQGAGKGILGYELPKN